MNTRPLARKTTKRGSVVITQIINKYEESSSTEPTSDRINTGEARTKTDSGCGLKNEAVKQRGIPSEERQDQSMTSSTARSRVNIPTPETKTNTVDSGGDNLPKRSISSSPRPISNTVIAPSNRTSTKYMEHAAREMRPSCSSPISGQSCAKRANNGQVYSFTTAEDDQFTFEFERGGSGPPFSIQKAQDVYPTVTTSENFMCIKTVSSIDPAAESGRIKSGDVILEVNGRSVKGLDLSKTETTLWAAGVHVNMLLCRPNHLMCRPKQLPTGPMPERTTVLPISKKKVPNLIGQTSNLTSALQAEKQPYRIASYHQHGEKFESDVREREHHETAGSVTDKSHSDLLDQKPVDTVERQKYPYQRDTIGEKQQDVIHKQEGQSGPNMMRENSKHLNTINTLPNPDDTNNTPSNPANTNNTPSEPAHTNKTPSRPVATSNTSSRPVATTNKTPSRSVATNNTPSNPANTNNAPTATAHTNKTPSGSVATSNTPSGSVATSNTPSDSVATSNTPSDSVATSNTPSDPTDTNNTPAGYRSTGPNAQGPNHKSKTKNGRPANLAEQEDIDENGEMYNVPIGSGQRENEPCNGDNQLMAIPEQLPTGTIGVQQIKCQMTQSQQINMTVNGGTTVLGNGNIIVHENAGEVQRSIEASGKKMTDEHIDQVRQIGQKVKISEEKVTEAIEIEGAEIKANTQREAEKLKSELEAKIDKSTGKVNGFIKEEGAVLAETVTNTGQAISQRLEKITEDKYNNLEANLQNLQRGMEEGNKHTKTKAVEAQILKEEVEKSLCETSKKSSMELSKIALEIRNTKQHLQVSETVGKEIKHDVEKNLKKFQQHIEESTKHAKTKAEETQKLKEDVEKSLRKTSEKSSHEFSNLEREMRNSEQRLLETVEKEIKHLRKEVSAIRQSLKEDLLKIMKDVHDSETTEMVGCFQRSVDTLMDKQKSVAEESQTFQQLLFAKLTELHKGIDLSNEHYLRSFGELRQQLRELQTKVDKMDEGFGNAEMIINITDGNGEIIDRLLRRGRVSENLPLPPWIPF